MQEIADMMNALYFMYMKTAPMLAFLLAVASSILYISRKRP